MQQPIDFNLLMSNVAKSRSFLDKAAGVMVGEEKQQFNKLLSMIDQSIAQTKTAVPDCKAAFEAEYEELKKQHEQNKKGLAQAKIQVAKLKEQIANGTLPKPEAPPETPVDTELGRQLRDEILAKFKSAPSTKQPSSGFAWQDWNLDGGWTSAESNTEQ